MRKRPQVQDATVAGWTAASGAAILVLASFSIPFLAGGMVWDWRWCLPVLFQAVWCLVEGGTTARFRSGGGIGPVRDLGLPWTTALVALAITLLALGDRFGQLRWTTASVGNPAIALLGAVIGGVGVALRRAAIRTLGDRFRDDIALGTDHVIERAGIYARFSHPGELGFALAMFGTVMMCRSLSAFAVYLGLLVPLMVIRIRRENRMLAVAPVTPG